MFIMAIVVLLTAISHYAIYYGALIRGYETSPGMAVRNILLLCLLLVTPLFLRFVLKYKGHWTAFTCAVFLLSIGFTVQYRLFSDPEYTSRKDKAEARQLKTRSLQMNYVQENYDADKKKIMGLPESPPSPVDLNTKSIKPASETTQDILLSGRTINPILALIAFLGVLILLRNRSVFELLEKNGVVIVLFTLIPLFFAALWSNAGKFAGNLTPWELSKIPFLIGFAAILTALYRNLGRTFWGIPRGRDVLPLVFMAVLPFLPFFILKDFGQMMVFSAVYATLYLIAVRRFPQRLVFVGSVVLAISVLVVGALPRDTQEKIPLLPTIASPVKSILPDRIQQRFHLWLDGFDPPSPETSWWKRDYDDYYARLVQNNPKLPEMLAENPEMQQTINVDAWFDVLAFQPAQATYGLASGKFSGRGLGLGYPELIPVSDSDYVYAAMGEELGLFGGLLITFALLLFVASGVRIALASRDMFGKLCAIGLVAFIGAQALVNIGGITRALPMTGITLPFISHGGFSLITSFIMLAMLMAISHRNTVDHLLDKIDA